MVKKYYKTRLKAQYYFMVFVAEEFWGIDLEDERLRV
jgi:hypothetical protein